MQFCLPLMKNAHGSNLTNGDIANASGASIPTVINTLKKYCEGGLAAAIKPARNPNSDTARIKATGEVEAKVIAKACTSPPTGKCKMDHNTVDGGMCRDS